MGRNRLANSILIVVHYFHILLSVIHSFILSYNHSHSPTHSFILGFIHSFIHPFFINSYFHSPIQGASKVVARSMATSTLNPATVAASSMKQMAADAKANAAKVVTASAPKPSQVLYEFEPQQRCSEAVEHQCHQGASSGVGWQF